jgi:hypothetical protein
MRYSKFLVRLVTINKSGAMYKRTWIMEKFCDILVKWKWRNLLMTWKLQIINILREKNLIFDIIIIICIDQLQIEHVFAWSSVLC